MIKRFLLLLVVVSVLVPTVYLVGIILIERSAIIYVNRRLGTNADEWKSIFDEFEALFDSSMTRHEVVAILVDIDPSLIGKLATNEAFTNKEFCLSAMRRSDSGEYSCGESVRLFEDVPIISSSIPLNYYFIYDQDLRFLRANRPASIE